MGVSAISVKGVFNKKFQICSKIHFSDNLSFLMSKELIKKFRLRYKLFCRCQGFQQCVIHGGFMPKSQSNWLSPRWYFLEYLQNQYDHPDPFKMNEKGQIDFQNLFLVLEYLKIIIMYRIYHI